jgi:5-hydroxyisourate hydrolase
MSQITTHVLDQSLGQPAAKVPVILEVLAAGGAWTEAGRGLTNGDGRLKDLGAAKGFGTGTYRLIFDTRTYFAAHSIEGLYPQVIIVFEVRDAKEHYHIPLLLSAYGYSTYRGS